MATLPSSASSGAASTGTSDSSVASFGRRLGLFSERIRRRFAARQLELHADRLDVPQLGQRRQLVEALQAEVVEELARRAEQLRTARHLAMTDDADPVALLQACA